MTLIKSTLFFMHSSRNIVGCLFGLVGLLLYYTEIISNNWLLIVVGLYVVGFSLMPSRPKIKFTYSGQLSSAELQRSLNKLLTAVEKKLPQGVLDIVVEIKNELESILRRFSDLKEDVHSAHVIQQIILDYLPTILDTYLKIPVMYAKMYLQKDGSTAEDIAVEQLKILLSQTQEISKMISERNISQLQVHHNFLKTKFQEVQ